MHMPTGNIGPKEELEKLYKKDKLTELSKEEHEAIEPLNRHERRAALVKMRKQKGKTK